MISPESLESRKDRALRVLSAAISFIQINYKDGGFGILASSSNILTVEVNSLPDDILGLDDEICGEIANLLKYKRSVFAFKHAKLVSCLRELNVEESNSTSMNPKFLTLCLMS